MADYYISNIIEKEVKPFLHSKNVSEALDKWKVFTFNRHVIFVYARFVELEKFSWDGIVTYRQLKFATYSLPLTRGLSEPK